MLDEPGTPSTSDTPGHLAPPRDLGFPKDLRIRSTSDFQRVYSRRVKCSEGGLLVYACENSGSEARLGLSVSRKFGKAVHRNRWKRRIREAFRLSRHELPPGVDLVVIPLSDESVPFEVLRQTLIRLSHRAAKRLGKRP